MSEIFKYISIIAAIVAIIVLGPILLIWSLNTLFPALAIPFTLETWIATFVLSGSFGTLIKSTISGYNS